MALSPAPPHPHTPLPPPPALASSPLGKQLLKGNKEALKCSPLQLRFSQMSSCLHPQGPVPWGVDRPSFVEGKTGKPLHVPGGNSRPWWYSLHRKQDLWKLLPSHWTSSAKYTVFWHTPHLLPPPQFGILEKNTKIRMRRGDENRLPAAGRPPRGWSVLGEYFRLALKTRLQSLLADVCVGEGPLLLPHPIHWGGCCVLALCLAPYTTRSQEARFTKNMQEQGKPAS